MNTVGDGSEPRNLLALVGGGRKALEHCDLGVSLTLRAGCVEHLRPSAMRVRPPGPTRGWAVPWADEKGRPRHGGRPSQVWSRRGRRYRSSTQRSASTSTIRE
jgi:hypothetical protein